MLLTAVVLALVVGATLGMFGGGGAVLAVPIFVYVLGVPLTHAVPMSFVVIGVSSAVGALVRWQSGYLDLGRGMAFGAAAVVGAFAGASVSGLVPEQVRFTLFALAVLVASVSLLRSASRDATAGPPRNMRSPVLGAVVFAGIGAFTAIVGVGGGFLFVPALVLLVGVPMLEATGLSLVIIAMNAGAALLWYTSEIAIDWPLALIFTAAAVTAMIPAGRIARQLPLPVMKRAFAGLLFVVGLFVLIRNIR